MQSDDPQLRAYYLPTKLRRGSLKFRDHVPFKASRISIRDRLDA